MTDDKQLQVVQDAGLPMQLSDAKQTLQYIEQVSRDILTDGVDYGLIPGTGSKPTLLKPGAEKLCMAWRLSPEFTEVDCIEDHANGFYFYKIRCNLIASQTGEIRGTQIGTCCSTERGKEKSPANTIIKIAQKRAHVGATLVATFMSGRFTQDMEDTHGNTGESLSKSDDTVVGPDGFASKYGTKDKPSHCNFCRQKHVLVGDIIMKTGEQYNGKDTYGAVACNPQKEDQKQEAINRSEGGGVDGPVARIQELEALWCEVDATEAEVVKARLDKTGKATVHEMNHVQCNNYIEFLEGLGLEV